MVELLKAEALSFAYHIEKIIEDLTLSVRKGEIVFIVGPNGSGKTTLLKCLGRILDPWGAIYVESVNIKDLTSKEVAKLFGYVPQRTDLSPLTVFDAILLGRIPYFEWSPDKRDIEVVQRVVDKLNLKHLIGKMLKELSGGELQKVILARALAQQPKILILDEPTNNLDLANQVEVMKIITDLRKEGVSSLITTHDLNLPSIYGDKVIMMKKGKIFASGDIDVLNKKNIREVYGVEVEIYTLKNRKVIFPESNCVDSHS
ncbi:MAG: ABC transporter ATP-binding protein [Thermodesulfobacteriota bacterium]